MSDGHIPTTKSNGVQRATRFVQAFRNTRVNRVIKTVNTKIGSSGLDTTRFKYFQIPAETPNGVILVFTLSEAYTAGTLTVYRDQLALQGTVDFTETSPTAGTFTVTSAPLTGEVLWANYIKA